MRSGIGLPYSINKTLKAIGLTKRMHSIFLPISQKSAGQILKIKELVKVEHAESVISRCEMRIQRQPPRGFDIIQLAEK